jgi:hypothetical protein
MVRGIAKFKKSWFFGVLIALAFAVPAQAHYPDEGYANARVLETSYDGACGGFPQVCVRKTGVQCGSLFGQHSRACWGLYREWWAGTARFYECEWWGRVEHSGRVVTHNTRC